MHMEICVRLFPGTAAPKILKFGTKIGYDLLYCVRQNQHPRAIIPFICSLFLSLKMFHHTFLTSYESQHIQILCTPTEG